MKIGVTLIALAIMFAVGSFALSQRGLMAIVGNDRLTEDKFQRLVAFYLIADPYMNLHDDGMLNEIYYSFIVNSVRLQLATERSIQVSEAAVREEFERLTGILELYYLLDLADDWGIEYDHDALVLGIGDPEDIADELFFIEQVLGTTGSVLLGNAFAAQNMSEAEFTQFIRQRLIMQELDNYIADAIVISDEEILEIYEMQRENRFSETRVISHILVSAFPYDEDDENFAEWMREEYEDALELINHIYEMLLSGVDEEGEEVSFAELAMRYSDCPSSAAGGYLGAGTSNDFFASYVFEFAAAAVELNEPGEVSGIVETEFGFHIILLDDIFSLSLDDVRVTIRNEILAERQYFERIRLIEEVQIRPDDIRNMLRIFAW
jgi:hypothetical protein